MVEIYFGVRDFGGFHTLKTLGQIPLEYEVSGPWDRLPRTRSSNGPRHFDSSTFGSLTCISRLSFRTMLDLLPRVPSIYDQDLLWLAELRGNLCVSISSNTQTLWIIVDLWTCVPPVSMVQINSMTPTFGSFGARPFLFSRSSTSSKRLTLPFLRLI
jgi:hypothetical protein